MQRTPAWARLVSLMSSLFPVTLRIVKSIFMRGPHRRNQAILKGPLRSSLALTSVLLSSSWFSEKFYPSASGIPTFSHKEDLTSLLSMGLPRSESFRPEEHPGPLLKDGGLLTELCWVMEGWDWYSWMRPSCPVFFIAGGSLIFYLNFWD